MTEFFGIDIAAVIHDAFDGELPAVTLRKSTVTLDGYGAPSSTFVDHTGQGVRLNWETAIAAARGYPADAVKVLMLQGDTPAPALGDTVTIGGSSFTIIGIEADPAGATWTIAGVPA